MGGIIERFRLDVRKHIVPASNALPVQNTKKFSAKTEPSGVWMQQMDAIWQRTLLYRSYRHVQIHQDHPDRDRLRIVHPRRVRRLAGAFF
jgi:hypothetical protein